MDRRPRRGEVWRVETPGMPTDPHTPRPALVVSTTARNYQKDDCIVVPVFSSGSLGPTRVRLAAGHGGIDHDSVVFCDEVTCLDLEFISLEDGPLGEPVPPSVLDEVVLKIRRAVGDMVPLQPGESYPNLQQ